MKILKRLALALIGLIVVLIGGAFLLPSKAHVERSVTISSPPEQVFAEVNDLKKWTAWSPWHARDPEMAVTYAGSASGQGASSSWKSGSEGSGTMTISGSTPSESIDMDLDFGEMGTATSFWKFSPDGEGTRVTWGFDTEAGNNPLKRLMGLAMDSMVGGDYQTGLENLKKICETAPAPIPAE